MIISFLSEKLKSNFLNSFSDNLIGFLVTILTINIASTSLIIGELVKIKEETNKYFERTIKEIKKSIYYQVVMILISFLTMIVKTSQVFIENFGSVYVSFFTNVILVAILFYFIDIIVDLGKALFSIMSFRK
jgi:hypothetical protein